jgi:hypothetical protein
LAVVARALDERSARATLALENAAKDVGVGTEQLGRLGERIAHDATNAIALDARARIGAAVAAAFASSAAAMDEHARQLQALDAALRGSRDAFARSQRRWLVVAPVALLTGCGLAVAGSLAWLEQARRDVERHRIEASLLRAYNEADVSLCGGRLCARVEASTRPATRGYAVVAARKARE